MIKLVKRKDVDIVKYDGCIGSSLQEIVYAYGWYLDIVTDDWSCLVLGDYEAVLPVPYVRIASNLYLKKILQPTFCQQLGLFYPKDISAELKNEFVSKLLDLSPKSYHFNAKNSFLLESRSISNERKVDPKTNYELKLSPSYKELANKYSKNLKRNLSKGRSGEMVMNDQCTVEGLISFKKENAKHRMKETHFKLMRNLYNTILERKLGFICQVTMQDEMIGGAFIIHSGGRLIHLTSVINEQGRTHGAMGFLFDNIIQKYAGSDTIFDFEGSMIPGIARFFKSFGGEKQDYYAI